MSKSITLLTADSPEVKKAAASVADIVELSGSLVVETNDDYEFAAAQLTHIRDAEKELEERRTSITGPLNQALKATNALFKPASESLAKAKASLSGLMLTYTKRIKAQQEEARAKAQAEREKEIRAAKAQLEAARIESEKAMESAKTEADIEEATRILDEADAAVQIAQVSAPTGVVEQAPAKGGHATRKRLVAEVTSFPKLLAHAAAELRYGRPGEPLWDAWSGILAVSLPKLSKLIEARGTDIPGVTTHTEETIAARGS